jgi:hypothetical protein
LHQKYNNRSDTVKRNNLMIRNVHNIDRILRVALAVAIFAAGLAAGSWLGLLGFIFLGTAAIGWCPIYHVLGISTCPVKQR